MSGLSTLLAALGGGAVGLANGLQQQQAMNFAKQQEGRLADAEKRRAASEALAMLQAQDAMGLVDAGAADKEHASGQLTNMLASLKIPGVNAEAGSAPTMQRAEEDTRQRVALPGLDGAVRQFVLDPTRSREGRQRAMALADYERQRSDSLEDTTRALQIKTGESERERRNAFQTFALAFPDSPLARAGYQPGVDYKAIMGREDALDRQTRQFRQQSALQDRADARADKRMQTAASADPASKASEGERAAAAFGVRAAESAQILGAMRPDQIPSTVGRVIGDHSVVGQSDTYRNWNLARKNFATAVLRKESGASISPSEFESVDAIYIPMPGDSPDLLAKKARARELAVQQLRTMAGRAAPPIAPTAAVPNDANPYR